MMVSNNTSSLLFILFVCIIICNTYSYENSEQETIDDSIMDTYISKHKSFFDDRHLIMKRPSNVKSRSILQNPRSDSAETYFNWAEKTQRPVEYLRGKRFWLFAKKDENDVNVDIVPNLNKQQTSLKQGLWRSGIVGRRRSEN